MARARSLWRAAEDRLYPTLISDPSSYQRGIAAIQAVVAELRRRCTDTQQLIAAEAAPDELLAAACPGGTVIPADLLVAVACGMADREMSAEKERRRRAEAIETARAAGRPWVVLAGPERPTALNDGRLVELHIPSGTLLEATVDPWSGEDWYRIDVILDAADGQHNVQSRSFAEREDWLAEYRCCRADVEAGRVGPSAELS
ncbi:hypothetical protein [Pseudonocardia acidicola]|uniref:Uncharacterized protein n=1 Tax=Pseudonocardia acidicola TaxID=2724939 RepID=A0ABX1SID0_9PSEU|nr:hypothetical protein [Pseudonocardia acidicola]NMI01336.1 hypothetical protein [Pseudonocardia acidicola]